MEKPIKNEKFGNGFSRLKFNSTVDRDAYFQYLKKDLSTLNIKKTGNIWITIAPIILPINNKKCIKSEIV